MNESHLATYLNDHLGGSVSAIELLENIAREFAGSIAERTALELRDDILADRGQLEALMAHLGIPKSAARRAGAWIAEKLLQVKLRLEDPKAGSFRLLESAEAVSVGVEGKRLLWRALSAAASGNAKLRMLDYENLITRAEDQRARLEALRLQAATATFCDLK